MEKLKALFSALFIALTLSSFAQPQNPIWCMPPYYYSFINYTLDSLPTGSSSSSPSDNYTGLPAKFCANAEADASGNLLFFIVDGIIYDKNGNEMGEIEANSGLTYDAAGNAEVAVVPDPGNCNRYYIFSSTTANSNMYTDQVDEIPYYSVIDMSLNLGLGGLINTTNMAYMDNTYDFDNNSRIFYAVTPLRSDNSRLIFVFDGFEHFYVYELNSTGLHYMHDFLDGVETLDIDSRSEMELYPMNNGNYRIAFESTSGSHSSPIPTLYISQTDSDGNLITGSTHSYWMSTHGLEFSPLGQYLYYTSGGGLGYINISDWSVHNLPSSDSDQSYFTHSQIELGHDGHLYYAGSNGLGALMDPNNPTTSAWNPNYINFSYTASDGDNPTSFSGYSGQVTYTLPDQIDEENYSNIFTQNLQCCLDYENYNDTDYTAATGTHLWSPTNPPSNFLYNTGTNTVYIKDKLIIPAGSNITITGMTFKFAPGAKVVVEKGNSNTPGGRLTLNNTTFTADTRCSAHNMWQGVVAEGNPAVSQLPAYGGKQQSYVTLENSSVIENAMIGIAAGGNATSGGAVIKATNSTFRDNLQDVVMMPYTDPDKTSNFTTFTKNTFITDRLLNSAVIDYPLMHVLLKNVRGVAFLGNVFENTNPTAFGLIYQHLGTGIYSYNSRVIVEPYCNLCPLPHPPGAGTPNVFKNLFFGIEHYSYTSARTLVCDQNNFVNNVYGIKMVGTAAASINQNDFKIHVGDDYHTLDYGLYMYGCTKYSVQENNFYDNGSTKPNDNTYGIIVTNSGGGHNEIYRNNFHELSIGGQSQGVNATGGTPSDPTNNVGLQWFCNDLYGNMYISDFAYTNYGATYGAIDYHQGKSITGGGAQAAINASANNHFSWDVWDYFSNPNVEDFHYNGTIDNNYHLRTGPNYFSGPITPEIAHYYPNYPSTEPDIQVAHNSAACPSKLNFSISIGHIEIGALTVSINHNLGLIDGGNKDSLINVIQSGMSPGQIKNVMMQYSPYLTSDVLLAYLGINPPNGHIKQVIEANSPVADTVMTVLNNMHLPHGIMRQISNAQTGTSALQQLNEKINYLETQRIEDIDAILRYYVADTAKTNAPEDSIIALLKRFSYIEGYKRLLAQFYLSRKEAAKAGYTNDSLKAEYGVCNDTRLTDIQLSICTDSCSCAHQAFSDDTTLVARTATIATAATGYPVCSRAQVLMAMALDTSVQTHIEPLIFGNNEDLVGTPNNSPFQNSAAAQMAKVKNPADISLYPNPPAFNKFNVTVTKVKNVQGTLRLYDLTGKLLLKRTITTGTNTISTKQLPDGIYLVKVNLSNGQHWQKKVVITNK